MVATVELFDDLDAVARDAGGALDRARMPSLFHRLDWFRLTLAHCPPPGRLLVVRAAEESARVWLFLMVDGGTARALASWYTLDFAPVVETGSEGANAGLMTAIAASLRRRRPRITRLELAPIVDPAGIKEGLEKAGWIVSVRSATVNWRVRVGGSGFADYWTRRPSRLRETARRRSGKAGLEFSVLSWFDEDAWHAYERVYARSWKPAEGSPAFLRALAEQEGAAGTLRLGVARKDGEPVAAQLWLVENGTATIHKLAHVEAARALSPGTLLSTAMFRAVIENDRPDWIDFGTGDDPYKADWMDECRILHRLEAFDPATAAGFAGAMRDRIGLLARRFRSG